MNFVFDPSLVLYLPLYELGGSSFMSKDACGHLCTVIGALWKPNGHFFDGSDDNISLGDNSHLNFAGDSSFSVLVWVNKTNSTGVLIGKNDYTAGVGWLIYTRSTDNNLVCYLNQGAAYARVLYTSSFNAWTLVGFIKDSTNKMRLLINGNEPTYVEQSNGININSPSGYNARIGGRSDLNASYFLGGLIGEVWVYGRPLTPSEIQHIYLATKGRYQ